MAPKNLSDKERHPWTFQNYLSEHRKSWDQFEQIEVLQWFGIWGLRRGGIRSGNSETCSPSSTHARANLNLGFQRKHGDQWLFVIFFWMAQESAIFSLQIKDLCMRRRSQQNWIVYGPIYNEAENWVRTTTYKYITFLWIVSLDSLNSEVQLETIIYIIKVFFFSVCVPGNPLIRAARYHIPRKAEPSIQSTNRTYCCVFYLVSGLNHCRSSLGVSWDISETLRFFIYRHKWSSSPCMWITRFISSNWIKKTSS
jgi:hypothetical protein